MNTITIAVEDANMVAAIRRVLSVMKGASVLSTTAKSIEVGDSAEEYGDSVPEQEVEAYRSAIPADLMQAVAEQAHEDLRQGRCMPLDGVLSEIKQSRGWM